MFLRLSLAFALGLLSFLSSLMLGLGQGDASLPVLMGIGAVTSFFLTDYRRVIQLGDWTVNVVVIFVVCFNVLDVLSHRGEDLAWSIARVLVFVQVVLFFREKDARFSWLILLISLLQVVVASIFQQNIVFALLLLAYVFVGLCAFVLLFFQQEHRYFRQHSFVKTFVETIKAEMAERQDRRKLARLALLTLLLGPLSLIVSSSKKKAGQETTHEKSQTQERLRSLFLIFPTEEYLAQQERWERIDEFDENVNTGNVHSVALPATTTSSTNPALRFPLLTERPRFSAGTRNPRAWSGNWRELFSHLTIGTFFAFLVAAIIFCLIPRVGRIEFYNFTFKQDFTRWEQPIRQQVNVGIVGINEEIQLGTLGTVIPHHRGVIQVRFLHHSDNTLLTETDLSDKLYREIVGATLYFRGIPLDTYSEGAWTQSLMSTPTSVADSDADPLRSAAILEPQNQDRILFAPNCDLVTLAMTIQPLDTSVFFAPHPFFSIRKPGEIALKNSHGRIEEVRRRRNEVSKTIVTAAFQKGVQLDLIPCRERIYRNHLLKVPEHGLESLQTLAALWDTESNFPKEDIISRARFMEQKFLHSSEFAYQLGGIIRDYDIDPLEDFIAHNPKGHCEYFAGALALMLRSVGIASQVIIGFKTEATSADCTIRQSDAHAWVEVYIPPEALAQHTSGDYAYWWQGGGILRLDPTPASSGGSAMIAAFTLRWADWSRTIQSFWNDFVLNMNPDRQTDLIYDPLYRAVPAVAYKVFNWKFWKEFCTDMILLYRSIVTDAWQQARWLWVGLYLLPPFVILGLLGLASWRLTSILLSMRKRTNDKIRRRITIEFYFRMERMLAKIGLVRGIALTPLEFARQSSFTPLMVPIVEAFYRVRFGNDVLSEEESQSVLQTLEQLERSITS